MLLIQRKSTWKTNNLKKAEKLAFFILHKKRAKANALTYYVLFNNKYAHVCEEIIKISCFIINCHAEY